VYDPLFGGIANTSHLCVTLGVSVEEGFPSRPKNDRLVCSKETKQ
jgi:hypothetical protein